MWKRVVAGGVLAVELAMGAAVFILSDCRHNNMQDDCPEDWPSTQPVLVATRDIQTGEEMDSPIKDGGIMENQVPMDALVDGAATDVSMVEGRTVAKPIGKNEQSPKITYLRSSPRLGSNREAGPP